MEALAWSSAITLGNAEMAGTHRLLFETMARLADTDGIDFVPAFSGMVDRLEADFRLEENLMEQLAYPQLRAHRAEHAGVLGRLHRAVAALQQGDPTAAHHALSDLPRWIAMHIASMDITLANTIGLVGTPSFQKGTPMFKHILLPTDGSPAAAEVVVSALRLAKQGGARVTVLHVLPEFHIVTHRPDMPGETRDLYQLDRLEQANQMLAGLTASARELDIDCKSLLLHDDQPDRCILNTALQEGCDLIAMASHGHLNLTGVLLGSVTHKVLVKSPLPVLVLRS